MLVDGINLLEGSQITNAVINSGPSFPVGPDHAPDQGELFYKTVADETYGIGIYTYDGSTWVAIASKAYVSDVINGQVTTIPYGPTLPSTVGAVDGQMFYKDNTADQIATGLYLFETGSNSWVEASIVASQVNAANVIGVLSVSSIPGLDWSKIDSGKPTTIAGYGITDAAPLGHVFNFDLHLTSSQNTWLDSITASAAEVNFLSGVSSGIQGQLDGKQPLDADLTAIAGLTGVSGFLTTNGVGGWTVDTNTYLTAHPVIGAASSVDNTGFTYIQDVSLDANGHVTGLVSTTIPNASTTVQGVVQLTDSTVTTSSTLGASATAVKAAYDLAGGAVIRAGDTMTGNLIMQAGTHITIADAPSAGTDAVNKIYVDSNLAGLTWKNSVKAATTANVDLATGGELTIDTIPLVAGNRVLVKEQTLPAENGIYIVAAGAWTRATDMDSTTPINEVNSAAVFVEQGATLADTGWTQINNVSALGTDPIAFTQFNGAAGITAGIGLSKSGNTLNVNLGAGIAQLPTDEVGIDLYANGGLMMTLDGSTSSSDTASQLSLEHVGIAGSYTKVTTDNFGRVTAGSNPTTLAGYGISDAQPLDADLTAISLLSGTAGLLHTDGAGAWSVDTAAYLTANETIAITGDATGSGTTAITLTLASSGVSPGTYKSVTVDSKGRVTSGTNPTTLAGYGIVDAAPLSHVSDDTVHLTSAQNTWLDAITASSAEINFLTGVTANVQTQLNGKLSLSGGTMTGSISIPTGSHISLADSPVSSTDATNKGYVDSVVSGLKWLNPIQGANLIGESTTPPSTPNYRDSYIVLDGAVGAWSGLNGHYVQWTGTAWNDLGLVAVGDRYGLSMQSVTTVTSPFTGKDNQIATITGGSSAGGYSYSYYTPGAQDTIMNNNTNAVGFGRSFTYNSDTSAWVEFGGPASIIAGIGLDYSGNTLNVVLGAGISEVPSGEVGIDVHGSGGLWTTVDGTNQSSVTGSQLGIKLADSTLALSTGGLTLGTSGVSVGTYKSVTVDVHGRVTAGTNPTTLSGYGITDAVQSTSVSTFNAGLLSTRPIAGTAGRFFYATDTFGLYYDNGAAWALESPAITGDVEISAGSTTATLANTAVTPGTYNNGATQITPFTVDSKGRITGTGTPVVITPAWSSITSKPTTLTGYGVTDTLTLTGDVTAPATALTTGSIATSLADTTVTPGSYGSATQVGTFTVDSKGRLTVAGNTTVTPAWGSITGKPTTLSGYGITDAVNTSALAAPNGVATLDGTGKLTSSQIPASILGAVVYQGVWDASTNTPTLASGVGTKGNYYKVSVAGTTTIDGISSWGINDVIIFNGTTWDRIDGVDAVDSVSGTTNQVTVTSTTGAVQVGLATDITGVDTITLGQAPTADAHAATKAYVDQMAMAMAIVFGG